MEECAFCNKLIDQASIVYIKGKPYHNTCLELKLLQLKLKLLKLKLKENKESQ